MSPPHRTRSPRPTKQRLSEASHHGPLPKVAADGTRPADAYAQKVKSNGKADAPRWRSARSLASQIAGANNVAFAKADLILDQVPTPADVDRALGRLETVARARGTAVGFADALPVSIERIARWIKAAESRGIQLVPITVAVAKAKSS